MSKSLTIKVSSKVHDYIQSRAVANRISRHEMATIVFNFGLQTAIKMAKEEEAKGENSELAKAVRGETSEV